MKLSACTGFLYILFDSIAFAPSPTPGTEAIHGSLLMMYGADGLEKLEMLWVSGAWEGFERISEVLYVLWLTGHGQNSESTIWKCTVLVLSSAS